MCSSDLGDDVVVPEGMENAEVKEAAAFSDFDTEDITFMENLGKACGIQVGAAVAALLKAQ